MLVGCAMMVWTMRGNYFHLVTDPGQSGRHIFAPQLVATTVMRWIGINKYEDFQNNRGPNKLESLIKLE